MNRATGWGFVYFIKSSTGLYKIGLAVDIERRFRELSIEYSSEDLELVRTIETENMMHTEQRFHNIFSKKRQHGEWFALESKDFALVDTIEEGIKAYLDDIR